MEKSVFLFDRKINRADRMRFYFHHSRYWQPLGQADLGCLVGLRRALNFGVNFIFSLSRLHDFARLFRRQIQGRTHRRDHLYRWLHQCANHQIFGGILEQFASAGQHHALWRNRHRPRNAQAFTANVRRLFFLLRFPVTASCKKRNHITQKQKKFLILTS